MEKNRLLLEYYIKGMNNDIRKEIEYKIRTSFLNLHREVAEDGVNDYVNVCKKYGFNAENLQRLIESLVVDYKAINQIMMENERYPLFKNPDDLLYSIDFRDSLIKSRPEAECNKIMGCETYDAYRPKIFPFKESSK